MSKIEVGQRVIIVKAEGHTIGKAKLLLRDPHPEHIGKSGIIISVDEADKIPRIRLDDGTELSGSECWWQPSRINKKGE